MPITRTGFDSGPREIPLDEFKEIKERNSGDFIPQGVSIIRGYGNIEHKLIIRVGDQKLYVKISPDGEVLSVEYANYGYKDSSYKKVKLPKPTLPYRIRTGFRPFLVSIFRKMYYQLAYGRRVVK
jgi:hypothetical protein